MIRTRFLYLFSAGLVVFAGLASRKYRKSLPTFLGDYAGDTLWALMLYLLVSTLIPKQSIQTRAVITLVLAILVEASQLYHAPWIDGIRNTTFGGLVLGFGFLWTDLVCYSVGITIGVCSEYAALRQFVIRRSWKGNSELE